MKTLVTTVTERGQVSIPAPVRRRMKLAPGRRLLWEQLSPTECRVRVSDDARPAGAVAMLGYAARFRKRRPTSAWIAEIRGGER
jgi:AbrB family looped-hinge helix DNA binding protein